MLISLLFILFCGLVFGSFITLASWRLPREEDIVVKPSRCPKCETRLGFFDLWPVLSWVLSGGKCRHCHAKVSARYPLTELVTAAVFLLIYAKYGLTAQAVVLALMAVALLIMIIVDIETYTIPDEVHLALLPLGLGYHVLIDSAPETPLLGFLFGMGLGLLLHHGYRRLRKKEGLGYGDVKFLAVAGLWLGLYNMIPFMFFSGIFGIVFGMLWRILGRGRLFPFGPSLAAALFLCVAFPDFPNFFWELLQPQR